MPGQPRVPRTLAQATTDYKTAIQTGNSMVALECLQDLMYHKVGDITSDLTDTQMAKMMEMEFGCNIQALVLAALQTMDNDSNAGIVSAVEKGLTNKSTFLTQMAKDGADLAVSGIDVSASVVSGIKSSSAELTSYAEIGALAALDTYDFVANACEGSKQAIEAKRQVLNEEAKSGSKSAIFESSSIVSASVVSGIKSSSAELTSYAKSGALAALGTYDFVANACEGSKQAIEAKRQVLNEEAKSGSKSAISESGSVITGYARSAFDKGVIIPAVEQALMNKKVSSQEEVRVAILSAYSAYALALDNAKSGFEEVVSRIINQSINLNDATVQYQVLLLSTSEAADRLVKTAEVFKDVVFTAERYASTVSDVLAIQRLQENVLDTTKVAINAISQLRTEWADDRKELFQTMSDVRELQDINTKFDMAYKSLQVVLGLTERVQEGIKMKSPEVDY